MPTSSNLIDLYPHNKVVFNKVLENLKTHNKVGVVQATGTGKGKLAACFVEFLMYHKSNAKILIVAPLRSILQNYQDNFDLDFQGVKYITYQKLYKLSDLDIISIIKTYDLIILDEFHRCGAEEWGKKVRVLFDYINNASCKIMGLTATPIRFLDNSRDMGVELFEGNIIQGVNLEDAIIDGILPGFVYNACYFGVEKVLKDVSDKLKNDMNKLTDISAKEKLLLKINRLSLLYTNRYKIENIIKEGTKHLGSTQKWVIFCKDKENLQEIYSYCSNWFIQKPKLYILYSDNSNNENNEVLLEFRKNKVGINVLLCINMLNEGVHIKDLNGVIMLRKTDSPILFLQQLGRSLEVGKTFKPIIFDLIGNYREFKIKNGNNGLSPIDIVRNIEEKTKSMENFVIIHNFTEDFDNVMDEISQYLYNSKVFWSEEEDSIIKEFYPMGGAYACQEKGIDKNESSIRYRAGYLGVKFLKGFDRWSKEEIDILKKYYMIGGTPLCKKKGLINKKDWEIGKAARDLGLNRDFSWTVEEDSILYEYFPDLASKGCIETGFSNKTINAIRERAKILGIKYNNSIWNTEEIEILVTFYPIGGCDLCIEKGLTSKTRDQIKNRAVKMKLSVIGKGYFTEYEDSIILKYYPIGGAVLCKKEGLEYRSKSSISGRANKLGLKVIDRSEHISIPWSKEEDDILMKYYQKGGVALCREKGLSLDRSSGSIRQRVIRLGLNEKQKTAPTPWTEEEKNIIFLYFPLGGAVLCQKNGLEHRNKHSIEEKARIWGVKRNEPIKVKWTLEEDEIIRKYYYLGVKECQNRGLSHRTDKAIIGRAKRLNANHKSEVNNDKFS